VRLALTRPVSPSIADCALTFLDRQPIDVGRAALQHGAYEACLEELGVRLVPLPAEPDLPDAVFVEDTAVVLDEVAIAAAPPLPARRREVAGVAQVLSRYRPVRSLGGGALLEGGDVLRIGRVLYVGLSGRTNREGAMQLAALAEPHGYDVRPVTFEGCLHLKTACTYIGRNSVLANRAWLDTAQIEGVEVVEVAPDEAGAGNALLVRDTVVMSASFPETCARLRARGFQVRAVDVSELEKAEAGVTCCSILFEDTDPGQRLRPARSWDAH
jgi:dimethylargininase